MLNIFKNKKSNYSVIISYIITCILFFILIELLQRQNFKSLYVFFSSNSITVNLYLLLFCIFTSLYVFIFKKPLICCGIHYSIWCIISFISNITSYFKGSPLIFEDLFLASEATDILSKYLNKQIILNVIFLFILITLILIILIKLSKTKSVKLFNTKYKSLNLASYILFLFVYLISINKLYNYGKHITYTLSDFNLSDTYNKNGFMYSFYKSIDLFLLTADNSNYNVENVLHIKNVLNDNPYISESPNENIILIQLESLFDPTKLKDVKFSEDPLKNYHNLSQNNESGEIIVPVIGGGTIQTEFEILTGINIKKLYTRMPYLNLLNTTPVESIAYIFRDYGYSTTAIHNYFSTFYNRVKAYESLGFDSFIPLETISLRDKNENFWYKDNILINEIITKIKSTNEKDFIFGVTVEAHGPYNTPINPVITVESNSLSEKDRIELQNYVNIIRHVDEFIVNLINALNSINESYTLIFYSDHLPALGDNHSTFDSLDEENLFKTPYLIIESNSEKTISIEKTNIHAYEFLHEILSDMKLNSTIYHKFREIFKNVENYQEYEKQLLLDIKSTRQNIYENQKFPHETSKINIGNIPQSIKDIIIENNEVFVIGDNFTVNSKILINQRKVESEYISKNRIKILNYTPNINDKFISVIFSNKNSPLNTSNEFIFLK